MKADAHDVDWWLEECGGDLDRGGKRRHRGVCGDEVPGSVDGDGRIWLVAAENDVERVAHRLQLGVLERSLGKGGSVTRREQQPIPLAKRNVQLLEDAEEQLAARQRATGLDEAQVAR